VIDVKKLKELKENKTFKIIMTVMRVLVYIILAGFIVVVCLQRFSDNKISFFDYRMFTVITGSMKPKYNVGDVLIAKKVEPSTIKVGDTITYLGTQGGFSDKVITHQVVKIQKDTAGKYLFHTKGLANLVEDPVVSENQIYGVVIYKSILLSTIYGIVGTNLGFYLFIIVPIIIVIGSEIFMTLLDREDKRREKLKNNS
jgi:signal peptidase